MKRTAGMARKARVEFEGALYHVLDRGHRREAIIGDDADPERFLLAPSGRLRPANQLPSP